ncbi:unnamed protein product [Allacma fusca]|uniref:Uncharacterized protein n=1 Tax=Allacma fusca TaxID=39272 RepID=A0A8J2PQI1_9HEXA|nr:unnamed protein product [Allacma fusca]
MDTDTTECENEEKSHSDKMEEATTIEDEVDGTVNKNKISHEWNENVNVHNELEADLTGRVDTLESREQKSSSIKPIDKNVVHRICSGQVVVTLATAVKELLENSIDAGAISVDIRLVEYGSKSIEVVDNGCGVEEVNFEGLALKHHTSKIQDFADITSIQTFGFRGEALSSLCALSDVIIVTKYGPTESKSSSAQGNSSSVHGFRIEYDSKGKIKKKSPCARAVGTTVIVKNLFFTLPVRHAEFIKNLKREFHRMVNVLNGYCLITSGVRIACTNQLQNGTVTNVINIPASSSTKEKISLMFGSKQVESLVEITECYACTDEDILSQYGLKEVTENPFKLTGFISIPYKGRSSNDRQFVYINSRPCDSTKIIRIVNDVYHNYSKNQSPFLFLDIRTQTMEVDVNVTPDKRMIYLRNEKILLATIQSTLSKVLQTVTCTYNREKQQLPMFSNSFINSPSAIVSKEAEARESVLFDSQYSTRKTTRESSSPKLSFGTKINKSDISRIPGKVLTTTSSCNSEMKEKKWKRIKLNSDGENEPSLPCDEIMQTSVHFNDSTHLSSDYLQIPTITTDEMDLEERESNQDVIVLYDDEFAIQGGVRTVELPVLNETDKPCKFDLYGATKMTSISLNLANLKDRMKKNVTCSTETSFEKSGRKFRARIAHEDNEAAEEELKRQLNKEMFQEMRVIGQFNLGFIITKHGSDIFIVDQHATDEKFNFEDLEKNLVLQSHRLICPVDLQLPAVSESVLTDNLPVFRKNGFDFNINVEASSRIQMTKIPFSKSVLFGKEDVEELIFLLEDAPERAFYRPSRIRDMLASRACRKSVMIGDHLSPKEMKRLVYHMSHMDQPWNCPHGRPTIRHLLNLNMIPTDYFDTFNH